MDPITSLILAPIVSNFIGALFNPRPKTPQPPPGLSYEEATTRAQTVLAPVFERMMQETLADVSRHNISRGFYGQAPGDALAERMARDVAGQEAMAIGSLADQMVGQTNQHAAQMAALAQQQWANQQQGFLGAGQLGQNFIEQMMQYSYIPRRQLTEMGMDHALRNWGVQMPVNTSGTTVTGASLSTPSLATSQPTQGQTWGAQHRVNSRWNSPYVGY